uniref:Uncharacterized protein n=1 Tax=Timema tahoe TaxID=61484 RepID=A0A7R9IIK5_9NEOP|nr:unnamed protein product [Timema tahoe]
MVGLCMGQTPPRPVRHACHHSRVWYRSSGAAAELVCVTSAMAAIRVGGVSSSSSSDPCPCPQCIINKPICAAEFSSHSRRIFSSECDMRCYNKCYDRSHYPARALNPGESLPIQPIESRACAVSTRLRRSCRAWRTNEVMSRSQVLSTLKGREFISPQRCLLPPTPAQPPLATIFYD